MNRMSINEIKSTYPEEWVLLVDPETNEVLNIRSGIVVAHSMKRRDIHEKLGQTHGRRAVYFTGEVAKSKVFAL